MQSNSTLGEKKNVTLPGCYVDLPTMTEKDRSDIVDFGIQYGVDLIAASFVRKGEDLGKLFRYATENFEYVA